MPDTRPRPASDDLYDQDFVCWTEREAARLRQSGARIDAAHIAEELEGLAARERRELSSRIATIIEHLLKLRSSRAAQSRAGWKRTVTRERHEIARLLEDSPSLRSELEDRIVRETPRAGLAARDALEEFGETPGHWTGHLFSKDEILLDWFPTPPGEAEQ